MIASILLGSSFGGLNRRNIGIAAAFLLACALLLGGASRLHELRLTIVILSSLPLLVMAGDTLGASKHETRVTRLAFVILLTLCFLPLAQLIPLPPAIWSNLPGRQELLLALDLAGLPAGWVPISLTPDRTWRSFLALLPPLAMFLGVIVCSGEQRLNLVKILIAITLASIVLGIAQVASGGERLYPWRTTDAGNLVGFFANRNHFATLCLIAIPFLGVLAARASRRSNDPRSQLWVWVAVAGVALGVVAIGVGVSRVGIGLMTPVVLCTILLFWMGSGRRLSPQVLALLGGALAGVLAVSMFALAPILSRFDSDVREGRFENWPTVFEAANKFLPVGSGLGSFDSVYRSVEPLVRLDSTFFNQAHNDYLEIWLETGWLGVALCGAFLVWFLRRGWLAWNSGISTELDLKRAATISIGVVLFHSFFDYPLRTEAVAVVFALCCGLLEDSFSTGRLNRTGSAR